MTKVIARLCHPWKLAFTDIFDPRETRSVCARFPVLTRAQESNITDVRDGFAVEEDGSSISGVEIKCEDDCEDENKGAQLASQKG